ncbi:nuclease-related domain protein [mine drainage metagenome]|uniref:Nuclease-related domain protein n=1 Tax=mine drainage metagenome TaxID=410659 RepID=A0A1J5QBI2_9ZZZZ
MLMTSLLPVAIAMALYILPIGLLLALVKLARRLSRHKDRRNPLTREHLRQPGHTVRAALEDAHFEILATAMATAPLPLFIYVELQGAHWQTTWLVIFGIFIAVGSAQLARKIFLLVRRSRKLQLGLDAEVAVGQELTALMPEGFWVFHDVKGGGPFNVDHVVVGRHGLFAVETKGRAKRIRESGGGHRLTLKDGRLEFPGWVETKPLEQARRNAAWLGEWLSSALGEPIRATPVLAIPGWYIERRSRSDVAVINGKSVAGYFTKSGAAELTEKQVAQIRHQLDARCRDVALHA